MNTRAEGNDVSTDGWMVLGRPPLTWLRTCPVGSDLVITLVGEADLAVEQDLKRALAAGVDARPRILVLDVGELFVDVRGLAALSATWHHGRGRGVEVVLARPSSLLRRMGRMMFSDGRLTAHETVGEALGQTHRTVGSPGHPPRSQ